VERVSKDFEGGNQKIRALEAVTFDVFPHEFLCIVGPSGCGKSTLLNAIAGFSLPTSGRLIANGVEVTLPGPDRGMVFQEYALFPWMTVADNISFGLKVKKLPKEKIREKVDTLLAKLQLVDFRDRFPKDLSGGMKQRVAIARVLVNEPEVMLMDEPFAALDAQTRIAMQMLLLRVWERLRTTILFITHDIDEAVFLGDRIYVMTARPGKIKSLIPVPLERPRRYEMVTSPAFNATKAKIFDLIKEETSALVGAFEV